MEEKNVKMITVLFTLYNVKDEDRRMAYTMYFKDVPSEVFEKALQKVTHSSEAKGFLPSVDQINVALDEVAEDILKKDPDNKLVRWSKIRSEIDRLVRGAPFCSLSIEAREVVQQYGGSSSLLKDSEFEERYTKFILPKLEKIFLSLKTKFNRNLLNDVIGGKVTVTMIENKIKQRTLELERSAEKMKQRLISSRKQINVSTTPDETPLKSDTN